MIRAYLALGSNLGDRLAYLQAAVDDLCERFVNVEVSPVYETDPVGGPEQGAYLNAVVAIDTDLEPRALLDVAHDIEATAHRVRAERWGPRTLDVDILLYGDVSVAEPDLEIPHPRMWERGFVLAPLRDIAADLVDERASWKGVRKAAVALRPCRKGSEASR